MYLFLLLTVSKSLFAQGQGGGIYIDDNGSCIGSVIRGNQAQDGFGIAGGDAIVLNSTVVNNDLLQQDTTKVVPGDIYCANGEIVDIVTYKKRSTKDAIGVVFWVSGDPKAIYPKGAVVALNETKGSWGLTGGLKIAEAWPESAVKRYFHLKDTACYGNTQKLYDEAMKSLNNQTSYKAGLYCYTYKAAKQVADHPIRWCLPVYRYLRRMFGTLPYVEATLKYLQQEHQGESGFEIELFSDKQIDYCWYWSSDDGLSGIVAEHVWTVNFITGSNGNMERGVSLKTKADNHIRPMFLY